MKVYTADGSLKVDTESAAANVSLEDAGGYWVDDNVEDALTELGNLMTEGWLVDSDSVNNTTPGTLIAEIDAGVGYQLVGWTLWAGVISALAARRVRIVVTYTDASTSTHDMADNTAPTIFGNGAGIVEHTNAMQAITLLDNTKKVQKVRVQTLGTAAGNRHGSVSGLRMPV